jgi:aryl carrier-like protein
LARGYHNRPELTAEKFIPNPFSSNPGARLYKTGDLARYLPDGSIEYLGRLDNQVKIRGLRIELGEIEAALDSHPAVRESVVVMREDQPGRKALIAYVAPRASTDVNGKKANDDMAAGKLPEVLIEHVKSKLPEYMAPAMVLLIDELPHTPSGKVDRKSLPAPASVAQAADREYVAPRTDNEKTLATIWMELLGLDKVSIQDNFFELGGDSLTGFRAVNRAKQAGLEMTMRMLFQHKTVAGIVKAMEVEGNGAISKASASIVTKVPRETRRRNLSITSI